MLIRLGSLSKIKNLMICSGNLGKFPSINRPASQLACLNAWPARNGSKPAACTARRPASLVRLPVSLAMIQSRFNSTEPAKTMAEAVKSSVEEIKKLDDVIDLSDFQVPNLPTAEEIMQMNLNITATDLGLTWWLPTGGLYVLFDLVHKCGIDWPAAIILATLIVRTLIWPIMISSRKSSIELSNFMKKFKKFREEYELAELKGNIMEINKVSLKYSDLMDSPEFKGFSSKSKFGYIKMPIIQSFVFMSFFITMRKMAYHPVPSLYESSFLWLPSLAEKDPYYVLPIITASTLLMTLKLGIDTGTAGMTELSKFQKVVVYALPLASLAITCNFPSALCLYWCTANGHSLLTAYLMQIKAVKKFLKLPEQVQDIETKETTMSSIIKFKDAVLDIKGSYRKHKNKSNIQNREKTDQQIFDSAGTGPIKKTFKYDPTKVKD